MHRSSLDILEKAQLPGDQAKAILEVMDLELESQREQLATQEGVSLEFEKFRLELRSVLAEFKTEMNQRFTKIEERLNSLELQIYTLRAETSRMILIASGTTVGAFGVMLGLFYFFTNHLGR